MAGFFRNHGSTLMILGTGVALGATATILLYEISTNIVRQLNVLVRKIEDLRRQVNELKAAVEERSSKKKKQTGYYSVNGSSGEEDDIFEEAVSGNEFDSAATNASITSEEYVSPTSANGGFPTSASLQQLLAQVDKLLDGTDQDKETSYHLLKNHRHLHGGSAEFLWRFAKCTYAMSQIEGGHGNEEAKKHYIYKSQEIATAAITLDDRNPSVHKWYAITLGSVGEYEGTQAKIQNGYAFKQHIEKAIQLCPEDPSSHYLLGRWCFGVYMLTWIERQVAATLFATPPTSTVDEALQHFMEAERLQPGKWKDNLLYIAKCHIEKRDYYEAVVWMDKANEIPTISQDDRIAQEELETLLYKYSGYTR